MKKAIFIFLASFCCITACYAQNFDIDILKPINKHQTYFKDKYLGGCVSSVTAISIGTPVILLTAGLINHDKKLQQDALYMAGSYIVCAGITQSVKRIVNRQRPFEKYDFIVKRYDEKNGRSFPSGHTSSAFCVATSLSLQYQKWYVIVPAYVWAGSVGWGRMYQGVHYPSDVLAGAVVGAGSAWLGYKVQRWMNKEKDVQDKSAKIF